jgi:acyl-CoA thioester hydrolase
MSADPPLDPQDYPFTHQVRVRFAETDAMGVVHHGRYLPYLESARVEYLRHVGHPYTQVRESGIDFSVIEVHLRYRAPLRFDDLVDVHVGIGQMGRASFQMQYLLTVDGAPCTTAWTRHAAVDAVDGTVRRIPEWMVALAGPTHQSDPDA